MRVLKFAAVAVGILILADASARADTNVSGSLSTNTTWTAAASPYLVTAHVTVNAGVTLTIEPGVVVRFADGMGLFVAGKLTAVGTAAQPITFTTSRATPVVGAWLGLEFRPGSDPMSAVSYATIAWAGNYYNRGVLVDSSSPHFDHVTLSSTQSSAIWIGGTAPHPVFESCTITGSGNYGIFLNSGTLEIQNSTITNNGNYAITAAPGTTVLGVTGMTVTGNGSGAKDALEYRGGTITGTERWRALDLPWVATSHVTVGAGATLTIDPGATVRFSDGMALFVAGKLTAVGTAAQPITFTTSKTTPVVGAWIGLEFQPGSDPTSAVSYATIAWAGNYFNRGVLVDSSSPHFDHVTFSNTQSSGVWIGGTAPHPVFESCTITGSGNYGIFLNSGTLEIQNSTITNNGNYAITAAPGTTVLGVTGMTVTGNGAGAKNAVEYRGGTIGGTERWRSLDVPWVATSHVTVASGATLTIDPGATVRFSDGMGLFVAGKLTGVGTAAQPITLTTARSTSSAGAWLGVEFQTTSDSTSALSYVTIDSAGNYFGRAILINAVSPQFDHVMVSNTNSSGIWIGGATAHPIFESCTITGSTNYAIYLNAGTLEIRNSTITNNTNYAITAGPGTTVLGVTGMTVTGNGTGAKNAIEYRGGSIGGIERWRSFDLPWVATSHVTVNAGASLTIDPGTTVRFADGMGLFVAGKLTAVGTSTQPVMLTTARTTPAVGAWIGLELQSTSDPSSRVGYAVVQWAGNYFGRAVLVSNASPQFDHLTVSDAGGYGVYVAGSLAHPLLANCVFLRNSNGLYKSADAAVDARICYWDSASGPSGAGQGTGESVSSGVSFEPWLLAPPAAGQSFTTAGATNRAFTPSIDTVSTVTVTATDAGTWTLNVSNAASTLVRSYSGTGAAATVSWDGRDSSGLAQTNGTYTYEWTITANGVSAAARGRMIIDSGVALISAISVSPSLFSPNGDGTLDTSTISGTSGFDDESWTVDVLNGGGSSVRSASGSGPISFVWDGKDATSAVQPDGVYTARLSVHAGTASDVRTATIELDTTPPALAVTSPSGGTLLSNVLQQGTLAIRGSISDLHLQSWTLDYGAGQAPSSWTTLASGSVAAADSQLATWDPLTFTNGPYTLRLRASDRVGIQSTVLSPVSVGNFTAAQDFYQVNAAAAGAINYSSIVPFDLTETLLIRDASGSTVKTIFNGLRTAGTYTDSWNGRNDAGNVLPDGPYFYVASVTDGSHSLTWDLSNQFRTEGWQYNYPTVSTDFDPFNNKPLSLTYSFPRAGRVYVIFSPTDHPTPCVAPAYCWKNKEYQAAGTYTVRWSGIDDSGTVRTDLARASVTNFVDSFPKNAVVVFGTKPVLSAVTVSPTFYGPAVGNQTISFSFTSYQSQASTVQVSFQNQASGSTLRTISLPNQSPGNVTVTWDGRADNGMWVAPGVYIVTATVIDPIGNSVKEQILTNVAY